MSRHSVWELVFLMVILKIPIVYLCSVVYYAIRAVPTPGEGAPVAVQVGTPDSGSGWRRGRPRALRPGPHGAPSRTYPRTPRTAATLAERRRP